MQEAVYKSKGCPPVVYSNLHTIFCMPDSDRGNAVLL